LEAFGRLGLARLAVLVLPFRWIVPSLGALKKETPANGLSDAQFVTVQLVTRAIARASRYTPWDSNCLAQALAAKRMLQRRGLASTLYLGAMLTDKRGLEAHAWVRCGAIYVSGGHIKDRFKVLSMFGD